MTKGIEEKLVIAGIPMYCGSNIDMFFMDSDYNISNTGQINVSNVHSHCEIAHLKNDSTDVIVTLSKANKEADLANRMIFYIDGDFGDVDFGSVPQLAGLFTDKEKGTVYCWNRTSGKLHEFTPEGKEIQKFSFPKQPTSYTKLDEKLIIGTKDGDIFYDGRKVASVNGEIKRVFVYEGKVFAVKGDRHSEYPCDARYEFSAEDFDPIQIEQDMYDWVTDIVPHKGNLFSSREQQVYKHSDYSVKIKHLNFPKGSIYTITPVDNALVVLNSFGDIAITDSNDFNFQKEKASMLKHPHSDSKYTSFTTYKLV